MWCGGWEKSGVTMWKEGVGGKIHILALTQVSRSEIEFIDICGTVKRQETSDLLKVIEVLRKAVDLAPKKICNLNRMHEHQHKYQHIWKNRRNRSLTIIKPRKKCDTFGFLREQRGGNRLTFCVYSFVCLVVLQFIKHWCIWGGTLPVNYPININYTVPERNVCKCLRRSKLLAL